MTCGHSSSLLCSLYHYLIKGIWLPKKSLVSFWFPNFFPMDFLKKKKKMGFFCSIHLSISYLFGFWVETYFLIDWASRKGWDQVWWGLQVCSRRYKHMVEVRRCWSSSLLKISRLELSKFLYTLIILHSGFLYRWEAHGFFIFYLLRDVPQNLMSLSFFFSFYSLIYFKLLISFVTWTCMSWNWCDYLLDIFWIIFYSIW